MRIATITLAATLSVGCGGLPLDELPDDRKAAPPLLTIEPDALTNDAECWQTRAAAFAEAAQTGEPVFFKCAGRPLEVARVES